MNLNICTTTTCVFSIQIIIEYTSGYYYTCIILFIQLRKNCSYTCTSAGRKFHYLVRILTGFDSIASFRFQCSATRN